MNKKLVSIVVPAYNVGNEIEDCIHSVQQQTYLHWELIVVNDGSKDNTRAIVEELAKNDTRIRLINQNNSGVSSARNTGIRESVGALLTFLDGDDMWEPTFLEDMLHAKETFQVEMVYCGYSHLYSGGIKRGFRYPYLNGHILHDVINKKTQIHIGAILVDKSLITKYNISFTEGCLVAQDQEFIKKVVFHAEVRAVPKELMIYRIRTGSAIRATWKWEKHIHAIYAFSRSIDFILSHENKNYNKEQLAQDLYARNAFNLYKLLWRMIKNGFHKEALTLMDDQQNAAIMQHLDLSKINLIQRAKFNAVSSRNKFLWRIARFL